MSALGDLLHYLFYPILRGFRLAPLAMLGVVFPIVPIAVAWPRRQLLSRPLK